MDDLKLLNCERPEVILRVTQHIPEIIQFIKVLVDSQLAYSVKSGSVYFNTQKFSVKSFYKPSDVILENNPKGEIVLSLVN